MEPQRYDTGTGAALTVQGFRLSPQQEHFCRLRTREDIGAVAQGRLEIAGDLDAAALRRALERVVERHEILRTTYQWLPGLTLPVQVVEEASPGFLWAEREGALERIAEADRATLFDLTRGPLLRATLVQVDAGRRILLLTMPALSADTVSLHRLADEIAAGDEREAPLQYADAAEILHEWLETSAVRVNLAGWEAALRRPAIAGGGPASIRTLRREIGPEETAAVAHAAERLGTSVPLLLLAAWYAALWHTTGEGEIVAGLELDGRTCAEMEEALGLFARCLPVRCGLGPGSTLRSLVAGLAPQVTELTEAQDGFPLDAVEDLLAVGGGAPVWPFGFACHRPGGSARFTFLGSHAEIDRCELRLVAVDAVPLRFELQIDSCRIGNAEAERLLARFVRVLAGLAAAPDLPLAELDVLSEAERRELLVDFNATAAPFPSDRCFHDLFTEQARLTPQATAVTAGDLRLTYAELDARANGLARHLRTLGVAPESLVGLCCERSPEMVVGLLGTLKAGGAYVPLDPGYPAERLAFLMEDSGVSVLLTQERLLSRLPADGPRIVCLDRDDSLTTGELPPRALPESPAYVIYTSGSTGKPKGVVVSHRGLVNYVAWARQAYDVRGGNRAPVHSPAGFDLTVTSLLVPLAAGAAVDLLPEEQSVAALGAALRERPGYSLVKITPAHLDVLRQVLTPPEAAGAARALVIGGEALTAESLAFWRQSAPGTRLINEYGPTETVVGCCVYEVRPEAPASGPVPIGRPIANMRLYVVGPGLRPVVAGVPGEMWIGGAGVARGYHGRPGLTAERFVPDPFSHESGGRLYRTGDLVRLRADGELEFLGRIDDQVKIRGFRIEPGEVEAALAAHPGVREAVVVARSDGSGRSDRSVRLQDDRRLVAYVTGDATADALRRSLAARLPDYMVPAFFVPLDALPLTAHGKVDRSALPAPPAHPEGEVYAAPRTLEEELLAEIWAGVLGVERVGIDDHFFTLGGDSIRSVQVLSLAQERGLSLTLQELFQHPTLRALGERVRLGQPRPAAEAVKPFDLVSAADRERLPPGVMDAYSLTRLQAGMLFHSEFAPESAVYHDLHSFHLRGRCDRELLQAALAQVVRRHPALRTSFDLTGFGEPLQLVHVEAEAPVAFEDLRHLDEAARERWIRGWLDAERHRAFDGSRAPLARFHVQRRGEDTFQFTLSFHHSILDGWSAAALLSELFRRYAALLAGSPPGDEEPPAATFRELVDLERLALASPEAAEHWRRHLEGAGIAAVPRRSAPRRATGARLLDVELPAGVSESLRRLARNAAVPLKCVLLGTHFRVMSLLAGTLDVVTGVVGHGRPERADGDQVLGLFLNTLPLRLHLSGGTWEDLARAAFELEREALPYRRFPLAELQRRNGGPLFETVFNFMHYHVYRSVAGVTGVQVLERTGYEETNFLLTAHFHLDPATSRVVLGLNYRSDALGPEEAAAIAGWYRAALCSMAAAPGSRYETASLLSEAERHQLLVEWNDTAAAVPSATLPALFEAQAGRTPEAVALVFEGERLTYRELDAAADRLAGRLRALGVGPESRVGVAMERSLDLLVALLGVLKAGGAYVPLDPGYPRERLAWMIEDAAAPVLLSHRRIAASLPAGTARVLCLDDPAEGGGRPAVSLEGENAAYVIYTSGSTGRPKGAVNTHAGIANRLLWMQAAYGLGPEDRVLQKTPFSFDVSVWELFWPLIAGARLVVARPGGHQDPAYLVREIVENGITTLHFVPSMLQVFLEEPDLGRCASLRRVICSGEALTPELRRRFFARLPGVELHNLYGPTEAAVDVTAWPCDPGDGAEQVAIGRPISNLRIHLLDPHLQPVPAGSPGELLIGGAGLARGYWNRPDLTAERFVPDPWGSLPGGRLYRTGDLARHRPDGAIEFLGRIDHQVKIRGFRIELGEVEAALAALPGVREAAAGLCRDEAGTRLAAWIAPTAGHSLDITHLREALRERLPEPMIPSAWVELAALPLTPSGKLDRRALPAPEAPRIAEAAHEAPRTPAERTLAEIWAKLFRIDRVGIRDNFFILGGDSILSIQVARRAQEAGIAITPRLLFQHPTIAELTAAAGTVRLASAEQGAVTGPVPLTPIQRWFFASLPAEPHHFNQSLLVETARRLDPARLGAALARIEAHHDALRLRFHQGPAGWEQEGTPPAGASPLTLVDLAALPEPLRAVEEAAAQAQTSLDLARGPLHRPVLFDLGEDHPGRFFWAAHHLAVDGVSWRILLDDLAALYGGSELPAKTTSFRSWSERLTGHAGAAETEAELAYWLGRPWTAVTRLPLDRSEGLEANTVASEAKESLLLDAEETRALLQEVPQAYNTRIDDVLLTALARGFRDLTGSPVLLVDLEGHGREEIFPDLDLSRTVGWFTSLYPVLLDLRGAADPEAALKTVKEQLRTVPRKGIGYGLLRWTGRHAAELAALPGPEVVFNYLGQLDRGLPDDSPFRPAREAAGPPWSPRRRRDHLLAFNGSVFGGRLGFTCTYSASLHRPETIRRLVAAVTARLRELIAHCRRPETGGYTPSDFPLASLSTDQLEKILATQKKGKRP